HPQIPARPRRHRPDDRAERPLGAGNLRFRHRARARPDPDDRQGRAYPERSAHRPALPRRRHGGQRSMNKRSIATVSLSGALDEKLRAIASAGFEAVEIFENDLLSFGAGPRDIAKLCRDLNLEICAFQPFRDFEGMPEPQRTRNFARAERKFDLMQELGTDLLLICSNVSPHSLGGIDRAADDLRALGERAASRRLRVGFEALAWGRHVRDYRDAWEIVRRADPAAIGLVLDSFHA